jgi:hypothetical protein
MNRRWRRSAFALVTRPATIGFGKSYPEFWINLRADMAPVAPESGVHICLRAKSTGDVDAFHAAALSAGGRSDGAPGLRPHDRVRITRRSSRSRRQPHRGGDVSGARAPWRERRGRCLHFPKVDGSAAAFSRVG